MRAIIVLGLLLLAGCVENAPQASESPDPSTEPPTTSQEPTHVDARESMQMGTTKLWAFRVEEGATSSFVVAVAGLDGNPAGVAGPDLCIRLEGPKEDRLGNCNGGGGNIVIQAGPPHIAIGETPFMEGQALPPGDYELSLFSGPALAEFHVTIDVTY